MEGGIRPFYGVKPREARPLSHDPADRSQPHPLPSALSS